MKKSIVKKIVVLSAAAVCLTAFSSCAFQEMDRNQKNLASIRIGMDKAQVLKIMGEPVENETYCSDNVFFYYTDQKWMDGLVTRDECTPIAFDDYGKVIGWGPGFGTGVQRFVIKK